MVAGKVLSINKVEVVIIDGYNFIKEIIDRMVNGDLKTCPYSGQAKDPNQWIAPDIFARAEKERRGKGLEIVMAAKKAFVQAGGVITEQLSSKRINEDLFKEIVSTGIGWLVENSEATIKEAHEQLIVFYPSEDEAVLGAAAATAYKLVKKQVEADKRHRQEWENAKMAVEIWVKKNPNNFLRPVVEIVDEIFFDRTIKVEASRSKVTKAVALKQRDLFWKHCLGAAKTYFFANPGELKQNLARHPAQIAEKITISVNHIPKEQIFKVLTAAVGQTQNDLCEKERQKYITAANNFYRKVKKPGSAARRGKGKGPKGNNKGGAKKRGVKGR